MQEINTVDPILPRARIRKHGMVSISSVPTDSNAP